MWQGWEYETPNGLHMVMSKRHWFVGNDSQAVCGAIAPKFGASRHEGDTACKKCENWCYKNQPSALQE